MLVLVVWFWISHIFRWTIIVLFLIVVLECEINLVAVEARKGMDDVAIID